MENIKRCFDLARLGSVGRGLYLRSGAVLKQDGKIISEGFRKSLNAPSALIDAFQNISKKEFNPLNETILYLSLEPSMEDFDSRTSITNLILKYKINKVFISCLNEINVNKGQWIKLAKSIGLKVVVGVLEQEGKDLNKMYYSFFQKKRPYILLKYAQSKDQFLGQYGKQIWLTNAKTKRLVHRWRSEFAAIMVGTNTAVTDDPALTNRLYYGRDPLRIVLDRQARISMDSKLYKGEAETWIISEEQAPINLPSHIIWVQILFDDKLLEQLLNRLYNSNISSLLLEGGAQLLNSFLERNLWDEARVFQTQKVLETGVEAPKIELRPLKTFQIGKDQLEVYQNNHSKL